LTQKTVNGYDFRHRRIGQIGDATDLVEMLFPGNRNQQHAAARILLALKGAEALVPSLSFLQQECGISRRSLERARAKLARLGLIERLTWMNARYGGQEGWRLSSRMSAALRLLAHKIDEWRRDERPERERKDLQLVELLR
jgi:hypothetical protein